MDKTRRGPILFRSWHFKWFIFTKAFGKHDQTSTLKIIMARWNIWDVIGYKIKTQNIHLKRQVVILVKIFSGLKQPVGEDNSRDWLTRLQSWGEQTIICVPHWYILCCYVVWFVVKLAFNSNQTLMGSFILVNLIINVIIQQIFDFLTSSQQRVTLCVIFTILIQRANSKSRVLFILTLNT